jgi:hypothetical protein
MYNRYSATLRQQRSALDASQRGPTGDRATMLRAAARRRRREAALAASYHHRVESWLSGTAAEIEAGARPPSPSYQTKNHAAHHRFRDRDKSKELGRPYISAGKQDRTAMTLSCPLWDDEQRRIAHARAEQGRSLLLEAYQQPNELPTHSKYPLRQRRAAGELHPPLKFGEAAEVERVLGATARHAMLETHGQYDHAMHASKAPGRHAPRTSATTAPHYREYRPDKWVGGKPLIATVGGGDLGLAAGDDLPHDYLDMEAGGRWLRYQGRVGSLARQRQQAREVDRERQFQPAVTSGAYVTGPDHRPWPTLPTDFASSAEFTTDHRSQYKAIGHYAHGFLGRGADGLPQLDSSFGHEPERIAMAQQVLAAQPRAR